MIANDSVKRRSHRASQDPLLAISQVAQHVNDNDIIVIRTDDSDEDL